MALNSTEITEAQAILADNTKTEKQRTQEFYAYLVSKGEDYGALGLGVTNNDTWQGQLANGFAERAGEDNSVDVSYNSTDWVSLNFDLAQAHMTAYVINNGGVPTRTQIQDYHNTVYVDHDLNEDDWFPNKMLNDSADADTLWADWQANINPLDIWQDGIAIAAAGGVGVVVTNIAASATGLLPPSNFTEAQWKFLANFSLALYDMDLAQKLELAGDLGLVNGIVTDHSWFFGSLSVVR